MKMIARKPCSFAGKKFFNGDMVPAEIVLDPHGQEKMGVLAIVNDDAGTTQHCNEVDTMTVVVHAEKGDMHLNLTQEDLQSVVYVLTSNVDDAEPVVAAMANGDALILLHMTDNRKSIKAAAEARAQALNAEESAGEQ